MFISNKYTNWYNNIIQQAISLNRVKRKRGHSDYVYYERHHIIPKSIGGTDDKVNLVLLTPKEHFICHLLLTRMCIDVKHTHKMVFALKFIMGNKLSVASSKIYSNLRQQIAESLSEIHKGKPKSSTQISKIVATRRLKDNYKTSDDTRKLLGSKARGRKQSEVTKKKRAISMQGKTHANRYWINNGETMQRVSHDKIEQFINLGWIRGRLALKHNAKDIVHRFVNGKKEVKYVDDVDYYLLNGWLMGRGPHSFGHCKSISQSRIGKTKTTSHRENLSKSVKKAWSEGRHRPL